MHCALFFWNSPGPPSPLNQLEAFWIRPKPSSKKIKKISIYTPNSVKMYILAGTLIFNIIED